MQNEKMQIDNMLDENKQNKDIQHENIRNGKVQNGIVRNGKIRSEEIQTQQILVEAQNLTKYYPIRRRRLFEKQKYLKAVEELNFQIPKGSTFGLVGESGCGKSTTGQMLADIFPATSGRIIYDGQDLTKMTRTHKRSIQRKIQIVLQDPYSSLDPKRTIGWILEEPLKIHTKLKKQERREKVRIILETVGLDESYAGRYPGELSGGQRQRVNIAAALMLDPEFVIADESVSALDVSVQAQILNLFKKLQWERKLTYLFISHDLNVVQYMSDYIGVMYLGHLVECGTVEDICDNPVHPYTKALLSAIPRERNNGRNRVVLKGEVPDQVHTPEGCPFHTRCAKAGIKCNCENPGLRKISETHFVSCHGAETVE